MTVLTSHQSGLVQWQTEHTNTHLLAGNWSAHMEVATSTEIHAKLALWSRATPQHNNWHLHGLTTASGPTAYGKIGNFRNPQILLTNHKSRPAAV